MQIVSKGGKIYCRTTVHYPPEVVRSMKKAGYTVKEIDDKPKGGRKKKGDSDEKNVCCSV